MRYLFKTNSDSDQPKRIYKLQIQIDLQIHLKVGWLGLNGHPSEVVPLSTMAVTNTSTTTCLPD